MRVKIKTMFNQHCHQSILLLMICKKDIIWVLSVMITLDLLMEMADHAEGGWSALCSWAVVFEICILEILNHKGKRGGGGYKNTFQ